MKNVLYFLRGMYRLIIGVHVQQFRLFIFGETLRGVLRFSSRSPHMSSRMMESNIIKLVESFLLLQQLDYDTYLADSDKRYLFAHAVRRFINSQQKKIF